MGYLLKFVTSFFMLIFLGLTHIKEAFDMYGSGAITLIGAIKMALSKSIDKGFLVTAMYIGNLGNYVLSAQMGTLIIDGFTVMLLFLLIFAIISFFIKFSTKKRLAFAFMLSFIILIAGAFISAMYHNVPMFSGIITTTSNVSGVVL